MTERGVYDEIIATKDRVGALILAMQAIQDDARGSGHDHIDHQLQCAITLTEDVADVIGKIQSKYEVEHKALFAGEGA